jgi:hypothetical protein
MFISLNHSSNKKEEKTKLSAFEWQQSIESTRAYIMEVWSDWIRILWAALKFRILFFSSIF